ncbi:MAG TPA: alpha/beta fold hydrolase [Verrucomicrobiae bacterium]|nr:alpha/beta fold hydrolase [Verrucomicrobiae bacterium]
MPKAKVNGIELYYEVHGSGDPLILIEGLGYATWQWCHQVKELSASYQTIIFDNRGVGESDKPDVPYTIEMMADEAAELLRVLGIDKAHVLGTSMGGYIGQRLAQRHPGLVLSLVLACTSFGGPHAIPITQAALNSMLNVNGLSPEQVIRQGFEAAFSREFPQQNPELIDQLVTWRMSKPTPRYAWERQFAAAAGFNGETELAEIMVPTLIVTGSEDLVIPPQNSVLLAERIPGAQLTTIQDGGHLFFMEKSIEFNRVVLDFLHSQSGFVPGQ